MKIVGIVAEYNPFHLGHEYQLKMARKNSQCDAVAVVMSGNFVQRGEPAIIDKFKRAECAIYGGADLVIELPMPFSCQNAELFAKAAVSELKKLNITHLSFGCENDDLNPLTEIALLQINNLEFNSLLKSELQTGLSYPAALTNAANKILGKDISNIITSPNNVLGIEYIKSATHLHCNWDIIPIKRIGKNHNDEMISGHFDSASAIRKSIMKCDISYKNSLTAKSLEMVDKFYDNYHGFNNLNNFYNQICYKILCLGSEGLNEIYEISEGLNNKIYANVFKYNNVDNFILSLKSKRYTYSKLRRILLNILLNIKKRDIENFMLTNRPDFSDNYNKFVKVLAFNDTGRQILKQLKNNDVYAVNRFSDYKKFNIEMDIFNMTNQSTNIFYLPFFNKTMNQEYIQNAVYVQIDHNR